MQELGLSWFRLVLLSSCFLIVTGYLFDYFYPVDLTPRSTSQVIVASDGSVLRAFPDSNGIWRYPIQMSQVSKNYLEALINYEDRYFYHHPGVNPFSLTRATWQWLKNGKIISGGSTLTMQVVRLRYPAKRTVLNKLLEIIKAFQLELHFSKTEILTYYLNHAPFGGTLEGLQAATYSYLGYSAQYLTDAQAALLAVLPQSPSQYRPDRHPTTAIKARNKLIKRLVNQQNWTAERASAAMNEPIDAIQLEQPMLAPLLSRRLQQESSISPVKTYINKDWQTRIANLLREHVVGIGKSVSAATLVVENATGNVVVYAGSADFSDRNRFSHVDMVKAIRSPGSTLKPFIYAMALDDGLIHSESLLMDVPLQFADYQPENYDHQFHGAVSASEALRMSLNIPAVQILDQLGSSRFFLRMQSSGIKLQLPKKAKPNLSIALGGVGIKLEELTSAYTAFSNQGQIVFPRFETNSTSQRQKLMSPGAAWIVKQMLTTSDCRFSNHSTIVKTGTSYRAQDTWAMSPGETYTIGVWVGQPNNVMMQSHQGRMTAVPLLKKILQITEENQFNITPKQRPITVAENDICWPSGIAANADCAYLRKAYVLNQTVPATWYDVRSSVNTDFTLLKKISVASDSNLLIEQPCQLDQNYKQIDLWPVVLKNWLSANQITESQIPSLDPRCETRNTTPLQSKLSMTGIGDKAILKYDSKGNNKIEIVATGGQQPYYWFLNGRQLTSTKEKITIKTNKKGKYRLSVISSNGQSAVTNFEVSFRD